MVKKGLMVLLAASMAVSLLFSTGCSSRMPPEEGALSEKEADPPLSPGGKEETAENAASDARLPLLQEEIKEVVYQASKAAFAMGVQGFEEEFKAGTKKPFAHYEDDLSPWYSDAILATLEDFYDFHLGEWGYEMGFAFPLHAKPLVDQGFVSLDQRVETRVLAEFNVQTGHEEWGIALFTLEKQPDGRWLITHME